MALFLSLQLHSADVIDEFQNEWHTFGIVDIQSNCALANTNTIVLHFTIDNSASMAEGCDDGNSKMKQVHQTLHNMLRFLVTVPKRIIISIDSFDNEIVNVVEFEALSEVNVDEIIREINTIQPAGATNIELALTNARTKLDAYIVDNPSHKIVHICLTDGCANKGETGCVALSALASEQYLNIYIGYGTDHDSLMLQTLGNKQFGDYYVITQMEFTKEVCGEITHNIVYSTLEHAYLEATNGELYDWRCNEWRARVYVSGIAGTNKKTIHIRTLTPDTVSVDLYGAMTWDDVVQCVDSTTPVPRLLNFDGDFTEPADFTKYMFRQRTQEKINQALRFNNARRCQNDLNQAMRYVTTDPIDAPDATIVSLKSELKAFFITMKEYMRFNQLETDVFMKELLDDLYVSYKTMGHSDGSMLCAGRQTSQGRQDINRPMQRQNACRNTSRTNTSRTNTSRTNTINTSFAEDTFVEDDAFIGHQFSQENSNVNDGMATVIRQVSSK